MPLSAPFRLNRSGMLLALVSAAFAGQAGAAAGRVDFTSGTVTVSGADGRERPLVKGVELDNGDTVRTAEGRAQIRFTDGAYVSLQPNTEFAIKDYRFEGKSDGSERGFFALAKGAMRTVTGFVGRVNRNRYQITTPTATVGIRGTGGVIQVLNDGSTLVVGTSGIWSLTNPAGTIDVPAGVSALAPATPDSPPQQTSQAPQAGPAPLAQNEIPFAQGEQRTATGNPAALPTVFPLRSGSGYAAGVAFGRSGTAQVQSSTAATAEFNAANQLVALSYSDGQVFKLDPVTGVHAESINNDGILAWGRWTGTVAGLAETYSPNQGFHYVVGTPTPTLPTDIRATYSLLGATSPTYVGNVAAPGQVQSGQLTVDFFSTSFNVQLSNFVVAMPDATYRLDGSGSNFSAASPAFSFSPTVTSTACSCFCSSSVNGFFAGASAERAGMNYRIENFGFAGGTTQVVGAAAFTKTGTEPVQQPAFNAMRAQ